MYVYTSGFLLTLPQKICIFVIVLCFCYQIIMFLSSVSYMIPQPHFKISSHLYHRLNQKQQLRVCNWNFWMSKMPLLMKIHTIKG